MDLSYNVIHAISTEYAETKCLLQEQNIAVFHPGWFQRELIESNRFNEEESEQLVSYAYNLYQNDHEINWFHLENNIHLILLNQPEVQQFLDFLENDKEVTEERLEEINNNHYIFPTNVFWKEVKEYLTKIHTQRHICPDCQEKGEIK